VAKVVAVMALSAERKGVDLNHFEDRSWQDLLRHALMMMDRLRFPPVSPA
jgi:hypothetical protein